VKELHAMALKVDEQRKLHDAWVHLQLHQLMVPCLMHVLKKLVKVW
jgi:hypothetical protein